MAAKIILADDSSTIRKVVRITLANSDFEIIDCESHKDIITLTKEHLPELTLLDFNLSDEQSGYVLTKSILSANPAGRVLLMFGTFDIVDEIELKKCGASDKVIKPFDSNKFVGICRALITEAKENPRRFVPAQDEVVVEEITFSEESEELMPEKIEVKEEIEEKVEQAEPQKEEVNLEGVLIPGVIGSKTEDLALEDIPGVIGHNYLKDDVVLNFSKKTNQEEHKLPDSADLDYPDLELDRKNDEIVIPTTAKLVAMDELNFDVLEETSVVNPMFEVKTERTEEELKKLEEEISLDISEDDLWAPDEKDNVKPEKKTEEKPVKTITSTALDEADDDLVSFTCVDDLEDLSGMSVVAEIDGDQSDQVEEVVKPIQKKQEVVAQDFESTMREKLKPIIEEMVKEYCKTTLEKVAWEVIPDLAENLIKKELSNISESVMKRD